MIISYLNEFVVLAQICKYHEAAEVLYISTSTLSKHIKSLEQELGHDLFVRTSRIVELTNFGTDFLPYAIKIVEIQEEYTKKLLQPQDHASRISIGTSQKVGNYSVMALMPTLKKECPCSQIQIIERQPGKLMEMLKKGELNFAIMDYTHQALLENSDDLEAAPFPEEPLVAVLPISHPLAGRKYVTMEELGEDAYIHLSDSLATEQHYDAKHLQSPSVTVSSCTQAIDLVGDGYGISLLPKNQAMYFKTDKIALVPIPNGPMISFFLIYRKENSRDPSVRAALKYMRIRNEQAEDSDENPEASAS